MNHLKRGFKIAGGLIAILVALFVGLIAYLLFVQDADMDSNLDLQTLHAGRAKYYVNDVASNVALFDNDTKAVVSGDLNKNEVYFVDLKDKTIQSIPLGDMRLFRVLPAEDRAIIIGSTKDQTKKALWVNSQGIGTELETYSAPIYTKDITVYNQNDQDIQTRIGEGQFKEMIELQTSSLRNDGSSRTMTEGFFNDTYFVDINQNNPSYYPLKAQSSKLIIDDFTQFPLPHYKDLDFQIEREPFIEYAGAISNQSIRSLAIRKDGKEIKQYDFENFYYYAVVVDNYLYLLGQTVKYIDLESL